MSKSPQTVVVTGASAGVGRAIAVGFGKRGWQVAVIARGHDGLESAKQEIKATGGKALAIQADVADADALMRAADQVELELGAIDVWVNNAMVTIYANITDIAPEEFHQVTQVTYLGQVYGTLAALKHMRRRNRGVIICIGSALAYRSIPFQGPYCAAKAAVREFVNSLRSELLYEGSKNSSHDGAFARGEYPAVRLGAQQVRSQGRSRAADLPAGNSRGCSRAGCR